MSSAHLQAGKAQFISTIRVDVKIVCKKTPQAKGREHWRLSRPHERTKSGQSDKGNTVLTGKTNT